MMKFSELGYRFANLLQQFFDDLADGKITAAEIGKRPSSRSMLSVEHRQLLNLIS